MYNEIDSIKKAFQVLKKAFQDCEKSIAEFELADKEVKDEINIILFYAKKQFTSIENDFKNDSLDAKTKKWIENRCNEIVSRMKNILSRIKVYEKSTTEKAVSDIKELFDKIESFKAVLLFDPIKQQKLIEQRQNLLRKSEKLNTDQQVIIRTTLLDATLKKVRRYMVDSGNSSPSVYLCYAPPHEKYAKEENWVADFLKNLIEHLKHAGISGTYFEITDTKHGENTYNFSDNVRESDYVLVFGTESLLEAHTTGTAPKTTSELSEILFKRSKDRKNNQFRVLPILLSGNDETAFPVYFHGYMKSKDWTEQNYVENLKSLIERLYDIGESNRKFYSIWQEYTEMPSPQSTLLTTTPIISSGSEEKTQQIGSKSTIQEYGLPPEYVDDDQDAKPFCRTGLATRTSAESKQTFNINSIGATPYGIFSQQTDVKKPVDIVMQKIIVALGDQKNKYQKMKDNKNIIDIRKLITSTLNVICNDKNYDRKLELKTLISLHNDLYSLENAECNFITKDDCAYKVIRGWFNTNEPHIKDVYQFTCKLTKHILYITQVNSSADSVVKKSDSTNLRPSF